MRNRTWIVGNWKMNATAALIDQLPAFATAAGDHATVVICPPYPWLGEAVRKADGLIIGAQDCHWNHDGPNTGRISATMLAGLGVRTTLVGHSECRAEGDTDEIVAAKGRAALAAGLRPIVCIGELSSDEDDTGFVLEQLRASWPSGPGHEQVLVAYEPTWAIGTGILPSCDQISATHSTIRKTLKQMLGQELARRIPILYGGSVTQTNAKAVASLADVDGLLVGRISLDAGSFVALISSTADSALD